MEQEIWKDVVGWEGHYQISNMGNVRIVKKTARKNTNRIPSKDKDGYLGLYLHDNKRHEWKKIHRMVAETFIPNPENKPCIDHINTIRTDNRASNLRWCTILENARNPLSRIHLSEARKGKKATDATRQKMSAQRKGLNNGMFGRRHTESTKAKMSIPIIQLTLDGQYVAEYYGANHAHEITGIHRQTIVSVLKGRGKTAGGYLWKYKK